MRHISEAAKQYLDMLRLAPRNHDYEPDGSGFCRVCDTPKGPHEVVAA